MLSKNKKNIILIISIIIFLIFLRAYDIKNPVSTNGIDEGIHLIQSKMVAEGYNYYDDLNGDQAPLAIIVFSVFHGDVMACRFLSLFLFLLSSIFLFFMAGKFGRDIAIISLLIIFLDFTLFRESRLASLDMFSASLLMIASYFFVRYIDAPSILNISVASFIMSLSLLSKIVPAFVVLFVLFYLFFMKRRWREGIISIIFLLLPLLALLSIFTPSQLIEGIIFRQGHRGFDIYSKASILLFLSSSFIYLLSIKKWDIKDEKILYLVAWIALIIIPVMVQGRTSQHHFVYASYPLAILSSIAIKEGYGKKKKILLIFVIFNLFLSLFFVVTAPPDTAYRVAGEIENITGRDAMVISGNPLVNVVANRNPPPNLTNLARYHYPDVTLSDIIYWLKTDDTQVVVLYYHLSEIEGLREYLENSSEWHYYKKVEGRGQILFDGVIPHFSRDVYEIYVRVD